MERSPGQYVGDTRCEQIPVTYCTRENCGMVPGPQECHDKVSIHNDVTMSDISNPYEAVFKGFLAFVVRC